MDHQTHSTIEKAPPPPKALPPAPEKNLPGGGDHLNEPKRRRWPWVVLVLLLIAGGVYYMRTRSAAPAQTGQGTGGGGGGRRRGAPGIMPVVAARAKRGNIGVYLTGLGSVTPIYTVTVKSRVDGELMQVLFKEGDLVRKGDLLAQIDPRPYQVQLEQYEGLQARDQALLENAKVDLTRYQTLLSQNAIPEQQLATQKSLVAQYEGNVKTDQGQIDSAKLNITYTHITAPITGRVGLRLVDPGNIVHAADPNGLLVITQIQPISVIFTIGEDQLQSVMTSSRGGRGLEVDAYDRDMQKKISQGSLSTIDNQIDQTTGTVKLRANFDNSKSELFPNQFVNARLLVQEKKNVVLVPTAVIQRSNNTYVYVVKPDSTVTIRPITVGTTEGDVSEVVSGLNPGEVAVMTGVDKLVEGSKVIAHVDGEAPPAGRGGPGGRGGRRGGASSNGATPDSATSPQNGSPNGAGKGQGNPANHNGQNRPGGAPRTLGQAQ